MLHSLSAAEGLSWQCCRWWWSTTALGSMSTPGTPYHYVIEYTHGTMANFGLAHADGMCCWWCAQQRSQTTHGCTQRPGPSSTHDAIRADADTRFSAGEQQHGDAGGWLCTQRRAPAQRVPPPCTDQPSTAQRGGHTQHGRDVLAGAPVQPGEGLVQQQQLGSPGQGHCQGRSALLAARQRGERGLQIDALHRHFFGRGDWRRWGCRYEWSCNRTRHNISSRCHLIGGEVGHRLARAVIAHGATCSTEMRTPSPLACCTCTHAHVHAHLHVGEGRPLARVGGDKPSSCLLAHAKQQKWALHSAVHGRGAC